MAIFNFLAKSAPRSRLITTQAPHHSVFTGRMPFLPPNQQRQSTDSRRLTATESNTLQTSQAIECKLSTVSRNASWHVLIFYIRRLWDCSQIRWDIKNYWRNIKTTLTGKHWLFHSRFKTFLFCKSFPSQPPTFSSPALVLRPLRTVADTYQHIRFYFISFFLCFFPIFCFWYRAVD